MSASEGPTSTAAPRRGVLRWGKQLAKRILHAGAVVPGPVLRPLLRASHDVMWITREAYEWVRRSLVATPLFLAQCESHGDEISVDRMPYMLGRCRIRLGSRVRISGLIGIKHSSRSSPLLVIGSNVFIGHGCAFAVAERIEIGDYCSIGNGTYIADTNSHSHRRLDVPIWEDPADPEDIAPVVIEDNVHIGQGCVILKGVRIGARSVVGANTVVRNNVPPDSIVAGNPARVAGWRQGAGPTRSAPGEGARPAAAPVPAQARERDSG